MKAQAPLSAVGKCGAAWRAAFGSLYFWSCVVYLVYTMQALAVDYCAVTRPAQSVLYNVSAPTVDDPYFYDAYFYDEPSPACDENGYTSINRQYEALASVHLVSAFMYGGAWRSWFAAHAATTPTWALALILAPEALNVAEAALYIYTSTLYAPLSVPSAENACYSDPACAGYDRLHRLELAAAVLSLAASVLWIWSWWYTFERGPGRGLSIFDPDLYSSLLLLVPSIMYVVYNVQIIADPVSYGTNFLYKAADAVFFVGAVLYVVAAMRDNGVFFFLPFVPGCAHNFDGEVAAEAAVTPSTARSAASRRGGAAKSADQETEQEGGGDKSTAVIVSRSRGSGGAAAAE
jgi:hypothetical protein